MLKIKGTNTKSSIRPLSEENHSSRPTDKTDRQTVRDHFSPAEYEGDHGPGNPDLGRRQRRVPPWKLPYELLVIHKAMSE